MPPPDTDLAARVRAGIAFLDQRLGAGWEDHIDGEELNLTSGVHCVLAQLATAGCFGFVVREDDTSTPFGRLRQQLGWRMGGSEIEHYGFGVELDRIATTTDWVGDLEALTAEWRAQLAARRAGKETP